MSSVETAEATELTQYLTFKLDEEIFAVGVSRVREVLEFAPITKVPRTPEYMQGVINVRGSVVPIIDLRLKFGMSKKEKTVDTCIIVMEVIIGDETIILGAVADSVQEVIAREQDQIEPPPRIGTGLNTEFINGMSKHDDHFIIILDIDKVFSTEDIAVVKETIKSQVQKSQKNSDN